MRTCQLAQRGARLRRRLLRHSLPAFAARVVSPLPTLWVLETITTLDLGWASLGTIWAKQSRPCAEDSWYRTKVLSTILFPTRVGTCPITHSIRQAISWWAT